MQYFAVGCVVFASIGPVFAQLPVQTLGGNPGQQQPTGNCSPDDPTCINSNNQWRPEQVQPGVSQGIVLQNTAPANPTNLQLPTNPQQQMLPQEIKTPLDPPTEFQQLVANSIGKMLPIYGAKLFRNPPSTFAPVNQVPVTPDYIIGPNDELLIQSWGQVTLNGRFVVDRSGNVFIPQAGSVHVAGVRFEQLQPYLKSQMGKIFRNFDLNVSMGQLRSIQVFVVGQGRRPGSWTISSLSTLVNAIFVTGGPTPQGSLRHIQLKRNGKLIADFDLYDLLLNGDKSNDVPLLPGDVIYIPPVGPQVAISGSVKVPAIYELKTGGPTTVQEALDLASGLTNVAAGDKIRLERVDQRHLRSILEIPLDAQGKATALQDGDLLEFIAVSGQYKDSVTLRGNVANPGRYAWKPGMKIQDLLPNKDALITRDYWLKRSQIGQSTTSYIPTCLPTTPYGIPGLRYGIPAGEEGDDPFWRYSSMRNPLLTGLPFESDDNALSYYTDGISLSQPFSATINPDGAPRLSDGGLDCGKPTENPSFIPNVNGQVSGISQVTANRGLSPQGQTQIPSSSLNLNQMSSATASIGGTTVSNASSGQFLPKNDVKLSEPDINWSYAVIERQSKENLTTSLLPFNLGKLVLEGDSSQNLELQPGDIVTIFSKADIRVPQSEQTRFVRLEGEFVSSGVYSVRRGETLRQLVRRAGGLSPEAYLYGSEFTRESTRRVQQQRLNEYVDQIALQASTVASAIASAGRSTQDSAAMAAAQQQNQNIVNSLRQARATGRVILELPADSNSIDQLPDLPLEDGDRFIVPRVPSTVSVDGAVYNQNSFVYDPSRRVGDYIRLAGGSNRDADNKRAYVIRSNGAVISKQYSSKLRGSGFDSLHIYPGDTIVIPLNLDKGKTMRIIVDVAQIVGQFGLALAAAHTVFQ